MAGFGKKIWGKALLVLSVTTLCTPALAQGPVWGATQWSPQVGMSFTHYLGNEAVAAESEMSFSFSFQDARSDAYDLSFNRNPALLDVRFDGEGVNALNVAGVNALMPKYALGAEEEGGFFSRINWGIVGMAAAAGGIYFLADKQNEDREDEASALENAPTRTAP